MNLHLKRWWQNRLAKDGYNHGCEHDANVHASQHMPCDLGRTLTLPNTMQTPTPRSACLAAEEAMAQPH